MSLIQVKLDLVYMTLKFKILGICFGLEKDTIYLHKKSKKIGTKAIHMIKIRKGKFKIIVALIPVSVCSFLKSLNLIILLKDLTITNVIEFYF